MPVHSTSSTRSNISIVPNVSLPGTNRLLINALDLFFLEENIPLEAETFLAYLNRLSITKVVISCKSDATPGIAARGSSGSLCSLRSIHSLISLHSFQSSQSSQSLQFRSPSDCVKTILLMDSDTVPTCIEGLSVCVIALLFYACVCQARGDSVSRTGYLGSLRWVLVHILQLSKKDTSRITALYSGWLNTSASVSNVFRTSDSLASMSKMCKRAIHQREYDTIVIQPFATLLYTRGKITIRNFNQYLSRK